MDAFSFIGQCLRTRRSLCGLAAAWGLALAVGLTLQASYDTRPGAFRPTAHRWPVESRLPRPADRPVVLVFVHPRCPCTTATLAELRKILDDASGNPAATIVLPRPEGSPPGFCEEALSRLQADWPRAEVVVDSQGSETHLFGATTSGHILVYSSQGELRFSGGITASRGHRGESPGRQALVAALQVAQDLPCERVPFPVFGCALLDSVAQEEL